MFGKKSEAYLQGYSAYTLGLDKENPYPVKGKEWTAWQHGWDEAFHAELNNLVKKWEDEHLYDK